MLHGNAIEVTKQQTSEKKKAAKELREAKWQRMREEKEFGAARDSTILAIQRCTDMLVGPFLRKNGLI